MRARWANVPVPEENLVAIGVGLALQRVTPTRLARPARSARTLGVTLIAAGALGTDALLSFWSLTGYSGGGKKLIAY